MLALSRKENQGIVLDNGVRIEVVGLAGNRVVIGIDAPDDVTILREELISRLAAYRVDVDASCLVSSNVFAR